MADVLLAVIILGIVSIAVVVDLGTVAIRIARRIRARVAAGGEGWKPK